MTSTPGKPPEPTIHQSRTRPEANEFAIKNRQTNDWFRHDATTMKVQQVEASRQRPQSTGDWMNAASSSANNGHHKRYASQQAHDKVHGHQEPWFKHDDNIHYVDPLRADRGSTVAKEVKDKLIGAGKQSMDWYKHNEQQTTANDSHTHCRLIGPLAQEIGHKLQSKSGAPEWFQDNAASCDRSHTKTRLTVQEAYENSERDRAGSTAPWGEVEEQQPQQPHHRVTSQQGQEIAAKLSSESENWFQHSDHDPSVTRNDDRRQSEVMRNASAKHRGTDMRQILDGASRSNVDVKPVRQRMTPEAQQFAAQSQKGSVNKILDQEHNKEYQSPERCPRAVKPEAAATFNKNKGSMDEFLQGYLAPPRNYETHKARPADKSFLAKQSGQGMLKTLTAEQPSARYSGQYARVVKPEAADYAERGRGTMAQMMTDVGRPTTMAAADVRGHCKGLRTEAAQEIARKYQQGSVGHLLC